MDEDDRPGYLMDFLKVFAIKYGNGGKFNAEDFYQTDSLQEIQDEFMFQVLDIAGFVKK